MKSIEQNFEYHFGHYSHSEYLKWIDEMNKNFSPSFIECIKEDLETEDEDNQRTIKELHIKKYQAAMRDKKIDQLLND